MNNYKHVLLSSVLLFFFLHNNWSQVLWEKKLNFNAPAISQISVNEDGGFYLESWAQVDEYNENGVLLNRINLPRELASDGGNMFVYEDQLYHMDYYFTFKLSTIDDEGQLVSQSDISGVDDFLFPGRIDLFDINTYVVSDVSRRSRKLMLYNTERGQLVLTEYDWYEIKNDLLYYTLNDDVFVYSKTGELLYTGQISNGEEAVKWVDELGNLHYSLHFFDNGNPVSVLDFKKDKEFNYERDYFIRRVDGFGGVEIPINDILWSSQSSIERQYAVTEIAEGLTFLYGYPTQSLRHYHLSENPIGANWVLVKEIPNSDEVLIFVGREGDPSSTYVYKVKTNIADFNGRVPLLSGGDTGTGHFFCENIPDFSYTVRGDAESQIPSSGYTVETNGAGGLEELFGISLSRQPGIGVALERYYTDSQNNGAGDMINDSTLLSIKFDRPVQPDEMGFVLTRVYSNQITITAKDENGNELTTNDINSWLLSLYKVEEDTWGDPILDSNTNTLVGTFAETPQKQFVYGSFFQGFSPGAAAFVIKNKVSEINFSFQNLHVDRNGKTVKLNFVATCAPEMSSEGPIDTEEENNNDNEEESMNETETTDSPLFGTYDWLKNEYSNCNNEILTEYDLGAFSFIYGSDGRLFFEDGTFYCQDSETRNCRELYDLTNETIGLEESCSGESNEGSNTGEQTNSLPTDVYPWMSSIVSNFNCDNLSVKEYNLGAFSFFYFDDGTNATLYFEDGTLYCSPGASLNCLSAYGLVQSQIANLWMCGNDSTSENTDDNDDDRSSLERAYPWINSIINCNNAQQITEYESSIFKFIYIEPQGELYFQDGTFYCGDSGSLDCRAAYNLSNPSNVWSCGGSGFRLDEPVSMEKNAGVNDVLLYPNPTQDIVNITTDSHVNSISVYNSSGQLVLLKTHLISTAEMLDVSALDSGLYFVKIETENDLVVKRLIISQD